MRFIGKDRYGRLQNDRKNICQGKQQPDLDVAEMFGKKKYRCEIQSAANNGPVNSVYKRIGNRPALMVRIYDFSASLWYCIELFKILRSTPIISKK